MFLIPKNPSCLARSHAEATRVCLAKLSCTAHSGRKFLYCSAVGVKQVAN